MRAFRTCGCVCVRDTARGPVCARACASRSMRVTKRERHAPCRKLLRSRSHTRLAITHAARDRKRLAFERGSHSQAARGVAVLRGPQSRAATQACHDDSVMTISASMLSRESLGFSLASRSPSGKARFTCASGVRARRRQCLEPSTQRERCWAS